MIINNVQYFDVDEVAAKLHISVSLVRSREHAGLLDEGLRSGAGGRKFWTQSSIDKAKLIMQKEPINKPKRKSVGRMAILPSKEMAEANPSREGLYNIKDLSKIFNLSIAGVRQRVGKTLPLPCVVAPRPGYRTPRHYWRKSIIDPLAEVK